MCIVSFIYVHTLPCLSFHVSGVLKLFFFFCLFSVYIKTLCICKLSGYTHWCLLKDRELFLFLLFRAQGSKSSSRTWFGNTFGLSSDHLVSPCVLQYI